MGEAAGTSFSVIAITYMATELGISPTENGIGLIIWLLASIPGAFLSTLVARRTDPLKSAIVHIVLIMMNVVLFAFLTEPGKLGKTYAILFSCGIGGGWKNNMDRLVSSSIIPEGQDGEMMGFFLFAGQSITWLPLVVFTAMNEAGIDPKIIIVALTIYLVIALIAFILIGNYPNARKEVNRETVYGKSGGDDDEDDTPTAQAVIYKSAATQEDEDDTPTTQAVVYDSITTQDSLDSEDGKKKKFPKEGKERESQRTTATTDVDDISL